MADIQMVLAAHYSRNLSFEVKKGLYGRIKQGMYPFRAPLGYVDNGEGKLKTIDPIKGPLVKQTFELYASGEYSITSLTHEMARRGLKGYNGRTVVRRNIETILRNPFYIGTFIIRGKLYEGAHKPLITAALFRKVAEIKAKRTIKKSTKHDMLFRGLITCGLCQRILTGEYQKTHTYYRCHTVGCKTCVREDRLSQLVRAELGRQQIAPDEAETLADQTKAWLADRSESSIEKSLKLRIAAAADKRDRLTDLLVDGTLSKDDFDTRQKNLAFELAHLREDLAHYQDKTKSLADYEAFLDLLTDLERAYVVANSQEKRRLLRQCFERIAFCGDSLLTKSSGSFRSRIECPQNPNKSGNNNKTEMKPFC